MTAATTRPDTRPDALPDVLPAALIVAHGQPSDPEPAEAEIAALAERVQALMPDWHVRSATLAMPGALGARLAEAGPAGLVYPLFMAGGWFTRVNLPAKLAEAGAAGWRVLPPFGEDPAVQALAVTLAREAAAWAGRDPADCAMLLAAHGSFRSTAPADVAARMAWKIWAEAGIGHVVPAFIDQQPQIATVAAGMPAGAIVLPFFAARGGHVIDDLPEALEEAGFDGVVLPPLGLDPRVPGLIAAGLRAARG